MPLRKVSINFGFNDLSKSIEKQCFSTSTGVYDETANAKFFGKFDALLGVWPIAPYT